MDKNVFAGIVGYEDIKLELLRILDQLRNPEKYAALGVDMPHGVLLNGQPGVGKSTFAKCFLEASGRKTFICRKDKSNGDFVKEIVRIFDEAIEAAPSVILLDDMDKFANGDEAHRNAEEFVTVQACIDKCKDKQVFVIATTNGLRKMPESLTRAGRFDHLLHISCPESKDAQEIISHYLSQKAYVADMDLRRIARLLKGYSCAKLESVVNLAGTYAAYEGCGQIRQEHVIKAILRTLYDAPEKSGADERCIPLIACHEAGHALVAELLEPDSVDLVTVLNHDSSSAGITVLYRDERYFFSKRLMEVRVMCLLAGKAATEICYGTVDPGVTSDMERAFHIVQRFVDNYCSCGFDKFVMEDSSQEVRKRRDMAVVGEMERYYAQTRQLLIENRAKLDALTARLTEEKLLLGDQVQQILKSA